MTVGRQPLTRLAHGGGCGCKIAPAVLRRILARTPQAAPFNALLVGSETSDDAAVWRLNDTQALVATTDFFMPVVDDPRDFGRIAAANALSDVYAMGGRPILALAVLGMPLGEVSEDDIAAILAGGAEVCAAAGVPVAGGHSIDSAEPIYGLVALGLVHPDRVATNRGARAGDLLILTKPLGVGVLSAALRQGRLSPQGYDDLLATTTLLNKAGADLAEAGLARAMTDVTGFGLLGHAREMAEGSGLEVRVDVRRTPVLPTALALAREGVRTGASARNFDSLDGLLEVEGVLSPPERDLLTDPQTSGGLLVAAPPEAATRVLEAAAASGARKAAVIGSFADGPPRVRVRAGS